MPLTLEIRNELEFITIRFPEFGIVAYALIVQFHERSGRAAQSIQQPKGAKSKIAVRIRTHDQSRIWRNHLAIRILDDWLTDSHTVFSGPSGKTDLQNELVRVLRAAGKNAEADRLQAIVDRSKLEMKRFDALHSVRVIRASGHILANTATYLL